MTKTRVAVAAALLLLLLGLPPVFGMLTESHVGEYVESLRERRLDVTIDEYERSWFSSRAKITVARSPSDFDATPLAEIFGPMTLAVDIHHGPVSVQDGFFLGMSELHARPVENGESGLDFTVDAQMTFGGTVHFLAEIMPFRHEGADGTVTFAGARGNGTIAGQRIDARATIDSLQATAAAGTLSIIGIRASSDYEQLSRPISPGAMSVEIDRVSFDTDDGPAFDATGVGFESRASVDAARERLNGQASFTLERARAANDSTIADARYEMSLENVDVAAAEAYYDLIASRGPDGMPDEPSSEDMELLHRLLAGGPSFAVNTLRFSFDGQPFEASLRVDVDSSALPPGGAADLDDAAIWSALLSGRAELAAAKTLVERIAAAVIKAQLAAQQGDDPSMPGASLDALAQAQVGLALGMLSAQGMIEDTGSLYRTKVSFENGELTINGRPMPFPMF